MLKEYNWNIRTYGLEPMLQLISFLAICMMLYFSIGNTLLFGEQHLHNPKAFSVSHYAPGQ